MLFNSNARLYTIIAGATILVGSYSYSDYLRTKISESDGKIKILEADAKEAKGVRIRLELANQEAESKFRDADKESRRLADVARRLRIPPPPPPAPVTAEELTLTMRVALSPGSLVIEDPNKDSILNAADAQKVFVYFEEAKRIPEFLVKVSSQEAAITSLESTVAAGKQSVTNCNQLVQAGTVELGIARQEVAILAKEVKQVKTRSKLEKFLWGAAGIGVGVLVGKR